MLRHLFIAALRNMQRNRLQSGIAILGLSIGITAALLMALVIRNQLSFDHFIPGYERTYMGVSKVTPPGRPTTYTMWTHRSAAGLLKLNSPEIEDSTRLMLAGQSETADKSVELKQGQIAAKEEIYWADPNVFNVLPLPTLSGDLVTALHTPDGIVLPRTIARKYFGRDDVVGQVILLNGHPMTVRAVIADLPANGTELQTGIFASGLASFSSFASDREENVGNFTITVYTYLRLKPGASLSDLEQRMPRLLAQLTSGRQNYAMPLLPLDQIPLFEGLYPGAKAKLSVAGLVGLLILFIASVNFVNLLTARAARRALEVGVRKACGAARPQLITQFLGESILTVFFATCIAVALSEWLLPMVNALLNAGGMLDYWRSPQLPVALLIGIVALGLMAGAYPAFVLSSFRPASVLKGRMSHSPLSIKIRNALVVLQFAILIGLVVAASVIYQQRAFATREGLRVNINQMLIVRGACAPSFREEVRKLPGVAGVSCAGVEFLGAAAFQSSITYKGESISLNTMRVDWGVFALYGIKPIAGSLATLSPVGDYDANAKAGLILNESAVKRLGFSSPQAAIGQSIPEPGRPNASLINIAAVVPDFTLQSIEQPIQPTAYDPRPLAHSASVISVKLKGQQIPETLSAIDRLWTATGQTSAVTRFFLDDHMQQLYLSLQREAQIFAVFSGVAIFLACLGLFGLSISTAERRTKEIGIRKAMGATSSDITRLLLWQFAKPVLWANLISWPIAWYAMTNWLSGFAYHITLTVWFFVGATLLAIIVALLTVSLQSFLVARAVPTIALRYE